MFSSYVYLEEGYLLPTISSENSFPMFRLNAPVVIRAKVKKVCTVYSQALLRDTRHRRSKVGENCSSLPASSSQRSSSQSSIPVEALIWGCHLDVQSLLQHCGLLPVDRMVILPCMLRYSWLFHHPPLAGIPVFLQCCLQSPFGLPDVDLAAAADVYLSSAWL